MNTGLTYGSTVKQDLKYTLSRQLEKRRDVALRRVPDKQRLASKQIEDIGEESISKGRKEIIIEPSCLVVITLITSL